MDFFEAQAAARKRTGALIALFIAAVAAIIAVVYGVVHVAIGPGAGPIDPVLFLQVAFGVGVLIAGGSAVRTASLRSGGPAVAELLGGRRVSSDTTDLEERKLLNVVEEMSVASGTPVPAVYVLDGEDGINAFAAGHTTHDAAVAVTRGGLRALTRDELQGVIAHEFSHILNGDMRLNIRLMGILYGILLLSVIGRGLLYAGPRGGGRRGQGSGGWIVLVGLAMLLVGYVGVFFGKMIKAAVSRQREYLADSAAVEFTRNPDGIAGALKKIGAQTQGSRIENHHAEELSHLFFANGLRSAVFGMLSTHPPLDDRIRRLDPSWEGDFSTVSSAPAPPEVHARAAGRHGSEATARRGGQGGTPAAMIASVGAPTAAHLAYAAALLERFPRDLDRAVHEPAEARALVFALIIADGAGDTEAEWQAVRSFGGDELEGKVRLLLSLVREEGADARLPLLDLALPALQNLSPAEAAGFRAGVEALIRADGRIRPFEYALTHTLARRLQGQSEAGGRRGREVRSFKPLRAEVEALLSAIAWAGSDGDPEKARAAFNAGAGLLPSDVGVIRLQDPDSVNISRVDEALTALEHASPGVQRRFLEACAESAAHDRHLHVAEAELLRAIAESLDCPMPPLLVG